MVAKVVSLCGRPTSVRSVKIESERFGIGWAEGPYAIAVATSVMKFASAEIPVEGRMLWYHGKWFMTRLTFSHVDCSNR